MDKMGMKGRSILAASLLAAILCVERGHVNPFQAWVPEALAQAAPDDDDDDDDADDDDVDDGSLDDDGDDMGSGGDADDAGAGGSAGGDDDGDVGDGDDADSGAPGGSAGGDDDDDDAGDDAGGGGAGTGGTGGDDDDDDDGAGSGGSSGNGGGADDVADAGDDDVDSRDDQRDDQRDAERVAVRRDGRGVGRFGLERDETLDDDGWLARRGEILALTTDTGLPGRAAALGLEILGREALPTLGPTLYRLRLPSSASVDGMLARLRAADPDGAFDYNHLYEDATNTRGAVRSVPAMPARPRLALSGPRPPVIGLIDTHIDTTHPALRRADIEQRQFTDAARDASAEHGTAVASVLVGDLGCLPGARLLGAGVFYVSGRGEARAAAANLVQALGWLTRRGVPVINMSLSGPPNLVLQAALARAAAAGHLIIAAVGNDGPAAPPAFPAAYDSVVAITAVGDDLRVYRRAIRGEHVEFAAPGVDVEAAAPGGFAAYSGTSFASPYAAAVAALALARPDPAVAGGLLESLRRSALDLGEPGHDAVYGHGLLRAERPAP